MSVSQHILRTNQMSDKHINFQAISRQITHCHVSFLWIIFNNNTCQHYNDRMDMSLGENGFFFRMYALHVLFHSSVEFVFSNSFYQNDILTMEILSYTCEIISWHLMFENNFRHIDTETIPELWHSNDSIFICHRSFEH